MADMTCEKTDWYCTELFQYPHKNKIGVYQCIYWMSTFCAPLEVIGYVYWSGSAFGTMRPTIEDALRHSISKVRRAVVWRGLKEKV